MNLTRREKMNTMTLYRECIEVDHMVARAIHENANFIISVAVGLLCFMRVIPVLDGFSLHFANMKSNLFVTPGEFIYMNIFEHITKYRKKVSLLIKHFNESWF